MKKIATVFLLAAPLWLPAQQDKFTLTGKVGSLSSPNKAFLVYSVNDETVVDSAELKAGVFAFSGTVNAPVIAQLFVSHDGKSFQNLGARRDFLELFLEGGKRQLAPADSVSKSTVIGSPLNADLVAYKKAMKPFDIAYSHLYTEYARAPEEKQKSPAFQKELNEKEGALQKDRKEAQLAFVKTHPSSMASLYVAGQAGGAVPQAEDVAPLYELLEASVKQSAAGKKYGAYVEKLLVVAIGKPAPEISLPDTAGRTVTLSSYKGKYVLVDFWASWCKPCRAENPVVIKAHEKYKAKGFDVIGVSLDREAARAAWLKAIRDDKLTWVQVSDLKDWKSPAAQDYSIQAIPQNFLLDPSGKIIAKNLRGEALEKKLSETLGSL